MKNTEIRSKRSRKYRGLSPDEVLDRVDKDLLQPISTLPDEVIESLMNVSPDNSMKRYLGIELAFDTLRTIRKRLCVKEKAERDARMCHPKSDLELPVDDLNTSKEQHTKQEFTDDTRTH